MVLPKRVKMAKLPTGCLMDRRPKTPYKFISHTGIMAYLVLMLGIHMFNYVNKTPFQNLCNATNSFTKIPMEFAFNEKYKYMYLLNLNMVNQLFMTIEVIQHDKISVKCKRKLTCQCVNCNKLCDTETTYVMIRHHDRPFKNSLFFMFVDGVNPKFFMTRIIETLLHL